MAEYLLENPDRGGMARGTFPKTILILLIVIVFLILATGYLFVSRPRVIYPSIRPVEVLGTYKPVGITFPFEGKILSLSIPVNGSVYLGAQGSVKEARLSRDIPDEEFIPAYYHAYIDDPHQEEFYRELLGAFRDLQGENALDEDEYLEMVAVAIQSLPYETDENLTAPKFPIETYVDGKGDCDDKSLLLAALLAREDYSVALLYFHPEAHMAVGLKGYRCDYQDTGYGYVATTNVTFIGTPPGKLAGGGNITSVPMVIPVANGTRLYGKCLETLTIQEALERTEGRIQALSRELSSLTARMNDLRATRRFAEYNQLLAQYNRLMEDYNGNAGVHNYIITHQDDRKGTYTWLKARAQV